MPEIDCKIFCDKGTETRRQGRGKQKKIPIAGLRILPIVSMCILTSVLLAGAWSAVNGQGEGKSSQNSSVSSELRSSASILPSWTSQQIAISSTGDRIVYYGRAGSQPAQLYLRNVNAREEVAIAGAESGGKPTPAFSVPGNTRFPIWAPDGKRIVFGSDLAGAGQWKTYAQLVDGSKPPELIFDVRKAGFGWIGPESFTQDGKTIVGEGALTVATEPQAGTAIVALNLGDAPVMTEIIPAQKGVGIYNVRLSPDGRLLAYVSTRSGRSEVWLSPYPGPGTATMVSKEGGQRIVWSRDGKRIFFVSGVRMMVADVTTDPDLQVTAPRILFDTIPYAFGDYYTQPNWDITPDGKYFVMIRGAQEDAAGSQDTSANRLKLITNFFAELRQKVPKR